MCWLFNCPRCGTPMNTNECSCGTVIAPQVFSAMKRLMELPCDDLFSEAFERTPALISPLPP